MDAQHFPFYIILSNYVLSILFYQNKDHNFRQIRYHVCIKMRCCKRRFYKRKTLSRQPNNEWLVEQFYSIFFDEIRRKFHKEFSSYSSEKNKKRDLSYFPPVISALLKR